ncbi:MAG: hypothetical protein ACLS5L_09950 [Faecalimonas sp.]
MNYNSVVLFYDILLPERFRNNYTTCLSANSIAQMKKYYRKQREQ